MRLVSTDTPATSAADKAPLKAYVLTTADWIDTRLPHGQLKLDTTPALDREVIPPPPPPNGLPPVDMPPEGDGWLEITNGTGARRSTWRVRVQPFPDDRALPIQDDAGFVRLSFEGISREDLLHFLYAHSVDVEQIEEVKHQSKTSAPYYLDALYGEKSDQFFLVPEGAVELPDCEPGRGRFAAAAHLERVFLRFATSPHLEGDQPR